MGERYITQEEGHCRYHCSNGRSFIFDCCDLPFFQSHACTVDDRGYATTDRKKKLISHVVMGASDDCVVDHINGDPFDNRRSNLRVTTMVQNHWNYGVSQRNTTGFKGIYKDHRSDGYHARICVNGKRIYLGKHPTPDEAARAYDKAARQWFGDYATLNFPETGEQAFVRRQC